jgi:hypothetical protein
LNTKSNSNLKRIIDGLLSLEAWHRPFEFNVVAPLHVALAFREARYSGSKECPVEFRVALKRATLIIVCDEAIRVPKATKVRAYPERKTKFGSEDALGKSISDSSTYSKELGANLTNAGIDLKAGHTSQVSGQFQTSTEARLSVEAELTQLIQMTYFDRDNEHHWDCTPIFGNRLEKNAHDGKSCLMELVPTKDNNLDDLGVQVMVRCQVDDIEISDIVVKDGHKNIKALKDLEVRIKVAKAVIKEKLAEAMLPTADTYHAFSTITLADMMVVPE